MGGLASSSFSACSRRYCGNPFARVGTEPAVLSPQHQTLPPATAQAEPPNAPSPADRDVTPLVSPVTGTATPSRRRRSDDTPPGQKVR